MSHPPPPPPKQAAAAADTVPLSSHVSASVRRSPRRTHPLLSTAEAEDAVMLVHNTRHHHHDATGLSAHTASVAEDAGGALRAVKRFRMEDETLAVSAEDDTTAPFPSDPSGWKAYMNTHHPSYSIKQNAKAIYELCLARSWLIPCTPSQKTSFMTQFCKRAEMLWEDDRLVGFAVQELQGTYLKPPASPLSLPETIKQKITAKNWASVKCETDTRKGVGFKDSPVIGLESTDLTRMVLPNDKCIADVSEDTLKCIKKWLRGNASSPSPTKARPTLCVAGDSGSGKTVLLLQLLAVVQTVLNLVNVACVTVYVKPTALHKHFDCGFPSLWDKIYNCLGKGANGAQDTTVTKPAAAVFDELVKSQAFGDLMKHYDISADEGSYFSEWRKTMPGDNEDLQKKTRDLAMYMTLVHLVRGELNDSHVKDLLPLLRRHAGDPNNKVLVVLALDEVGCNVAASHAVCAVQGHLQRDLFGGKENAFVRTAMAGTGLTASALPPGSIPEDYHILHLGGPRGSAVSKSIFKRHLEAQGWDADVAKKYLDVVTAQPFMESLVLGNLRLGALYAASLHEFVDKVFSQDRVKLADVSAAVLDAVAMITVNKFKGLNGLKSVDDDRDLFRILLKATELHTVPYPAGDVGMQEELSDLSGLWGVVTDVAEWANASRNTAANSLKDTYCEVKPQHAQTDTHTPAQHAVLVVPARTSRIELNRGTVATLALMLFGFVPQTSVSGEGLEQAAVMTVMLLVAALRLMPLGALRIVLRHGEPLTPSALRTWLKRSDVTTADLASRDTLWKALGWEAAPWAGPPPVAVRLWDLVADSKKPAQTTSNAEEDDSEPTAADVFPPEHPGPMPEPDFLDCVNDQRLRGTSACVLAALSPPKAAFADGVVGLTHGNKKDGFLVLIQSKDLSSPLQLYEFFNEMYKMGHRGKQSVAGYLAMTAPDFGKADAKAKRNLCELLVHLPTLQAMYAKWARDEILKEQEERKRPEKEMKEERMQIVEKEMAERQGADGGGAAEDQKARTKGGTKKDPPSRTAPTEEAQLARFFDLLRLPQKKRESLKQFPRVKTFDELCERFAADAGVWQEACRLLGPSDDLAKYCAAFGCTNPYGSATAAGSENQPSNVMFVMYCTSASVPLMLKCVLDSMSIDFSKIWDDDIGIILSDGTRLLCTLPTSKRTTHFSTPRVPECTKC